MNYKQQILENFPYLEKYKQFKSGLVLYYNAKGKPVYLERAENIWKKIYSTAIKNEKIKNNKFKNLVKNNEFCIDIIHNSSQICYYLIFLKFFTIKYKEDFLIKSPNLNFSYINSNIRNKILSAYNSNNFNFLKFTRKTSYINFKKCFKILTSDLSSREKKIFFNIRKKPEIGTIDKKLFKSVKINNKIKVDILDKIKFLLEKNISIEETKSIKTLYNKLVNQNKIKHIDLVVVQRLWNKLKIKPNNLNTANNKQSSY